MTDVNSQPLRPNLTTNELRSLYFRFFAQRGHKIIPSASLIPENDGSVLFTTAGMHPLIPYLLGQEHPAGTRLVDCQKCVRTNDIEEVGDLTHLTFFEMLGNWSLGDYYKEESIRWSFEFLTTAEGLQLPPDVIWVTVFAGEGQVPRDEEAAALWRSHGIPAERIVFLGMEHNWWAAGPEGPCGPDTEIFIDRTRVACSRGKECLPGVCGCGRFFEVWNNVFMSYDRRGNEIQPLAKKNVDTGMGVERTLAVLNGAETVYETTSFRPIVEAILRHSRFSEAEIRADAQRLKAMRVLADHLRTCTFMIGDQRGVKPSNQGQGYVLRRLIRRAIRNCEHLGVESSNWVQAAAVVVEMFGEQYPELVQNREVIHKELMREKERFEQTLAKGTRVLAKEIEALLAEGKQMLSGEVAFRLYDTYGFPVEFTAEEARARGLSVDMEGFASAFAEHQTKSRTEAAKSGLADDSEESVKYHTATHLLHAALRKVLGTHVHQKGSNINRERLRFDFAFERAMTRDEIAQVEQLIQGWIDADIAVERSVMALEQARSAGAIGLFSDKYGDEVSVYRIGDTSLEFCGGPHVERTSQIGQFKITKEQSSAAGVRRIRAQVS